MFNSILDIMRSFANVNGDELCIVDESGALTYRQVIDRIQQYATCLAKFGVTESDRVSVCCTQDADFVITCLACNALGAVFVPIEKEASSFRIQEIINETESILTVYGEHQPEDLKGLSISIDELKTDGAVNSAFTFAKLAPDSLSELLFTTGSTGKSKGIEITCDNNIALAENIAIGTEMREHNVELIPLPISHSHALRTFYANMLRHDTVVITNGVANIRLIYDLMKRYHVTAIDLSPSAALIYCAFREVNLLNSTRYLIILNWVQLFYHRLLKMN